MILKNTIIPKDFEIIIFVQDGLIKSYTEIPHTVFSACPLAKIVAGMHFCTCFKNYCSYPKFTRKWKSIPISVKSRLSTYRFASVRINGFRGIKAQVVCYQCHPRYKSDCRVEHGMYCLSLGNLPVPSRRNIPHTDSFLWFSRGKYLCLLLFEKPKILTKFNALHKPSHHG